MNTVTVCKLVGGGVVDIQNVTAAQAEDYIARGYYQCGDGNSPDTGYCIATPAGNDCTSAPVSTPTPATSVGTPPPATSKLPGVGPESFSVWVVLFMLFFAMGFMVYSAFHEWRK